ncbi:hypothetical protein ACA910_018558 [Epithemia clementina (nom. ined.)]
MEKPKLDSSRLKDGVGFFEALDVGGVPVNALHNMGQVVRTSVVEIMAVIKNGATRIDRDVLQGKVPVTTAASVPVDASGAGVMWNVTE